jgi:DnaJ-class molecular chaperone
MADKGLTAHDLAEIAAANERAPDSAAEKRRAYDRERKAEKRAEAKSGGMSGGNPPDPAPNDSFGSGEGGNGLVIEKAAR